MSRLAANARVYREQFPRLSEAIEPALLCSTLADHFARELPAWAVEIESVAIDRIQIRPEHDVRLVYRVRGRERSGITFERWFHARMTPDGTPPRRRASWPESWAGCAPFPPVTVWPEMGMVLATFPWDPDLPKLAALVDPHEIADQANACREALGFEPALPIEVREVQPVKYRPGKHALARYGLAERGASSERRADVYAKIYGRVDGGRVQRAIESVRGALPAGGAGFEVPRAIAWFPETSTLWQEEWPGTKLSVLDPDHGWAHRTDDPTLPRIAAALAGLHRIDRVAGSFAPAPTADAVLQNSREEVTDIVRFLPRRSTTLERALSTLERSRPLAEAPAPYTLLHGTFKIAQVLVRGDRLGVVDWDGVAWGDPLLDVGEFAASHLYLSVSHGIPLPLVMRAFERFLDAYEDAVPWSCDRSRVLWYVAGFLLGKIHASLKTLEWATDEQLDPAFELLWSTLVPAEVRIGARSLE